MKDRIPLYPGRVKLTPVAGQVNTYDMVRADQPEQEGTPLNKETLLKDATATALGLSQEDPTVDDAFSKLSAASLIKKVPKYVETNLGGVPVGSTIKLNVNGAAKDFIVVHQGKPSSLYDDSCNGTWLLMKDVYENRQWHSSNSNSYKDSTIHSYLNSTFLNLFDADIKAQIKSVKIPYVNGTGSSSVASGSSGLSSKIFLLSGYEAGWTNSNSSNFPVDGAKLDYFTGGDSTDVRKKRIAQLDGSATHWWLRSPSTSSTTSALLVGPTGGYDATECSYSFGIRPALVLPETFGIYYVDSDGNAHDEQEYEDTLTDVLGVPFKGGTKIAYGTYVGTGTYGESNPNSLTFEFEPKLVIIADQSESGYIATFIRNAAGRGTQYSSGTNLYIAMRTTWIGSTLSWYIYSSYNTKSAVVQLNASGITYYYVAIG